MRKGLAWLGRKQWLAGLLAGLFHGAVSALPVEHEQRRLLLATDTAVQEQRWEDAAGYLARLEALGEQRKLDYHYLRGRIMLQQNQLDEARAALETYVTGADVDSERYRDALVLITRIEQRASVAESAEPVAVIEPAGPAGSAAPALKAGEQALSQQVAQINQQLSRLAYRSGKIIRLDEPPEVEYAFGQGGGGVLTIRETRLSAAGSPETVMRSLPVYGINPQVRFGCQDAGQGCWLYDPRDGRRWLQLADRPAEVEALAVRIGALIRAVQAP